MMNESHRASVTKGATPPSKPLMIFDGDCDFCIRWIARWREATGDRVDYQPYQRVEGEYPQISRPQFQAAVQLIEPDGAITSGADAVFRALSYSRRRRLVGLARALPGVMTIARLAYGVVAKHRPFFSFLTWLLWGRSVKRPTYHLASWLFIRGLGVIYLIAFTSLAVQVIGLLGSHGILPVSDYLSAWQRQLGASAYWRLPSLFWLNSSDPMLLGLCIGGTIISCAVIAGFAPSICLIVLWAFYLSLVSVGRVFLSYQWDALLLETGLLAILFAPIFGVIGSPPARRIARWLLLWLLFRLTFESGMVKLASGDPGWRDLTALTYHYWTQPLPIWSSWYLSALPLWARKLSVAIMFAIELVAPFSILAPRNVRWLGCAAMIILQLAIAASGNYCFFNLLTILLCLLLLDDEVWPRRWVLFISSMPKGSFWPWWVVSPIAVMVLLITSLELLTVSHVDYRAPAMVRSLYGAIAPLRSTNSYGLFAVITKTRPEIVIEGSDDQVVWKAYEFKWKPGRLERRPGLVAPHQPRLDWQMWFASLGSYQENPWFLQFLRRLLEGSPAVLKLLGDNPFPNHPPRFIRASLYQYRFTTPAEGSEAWWKREYEGEYCPVVTLGGQK